VIRGHKIAGEYQNGEYEKADDNVREDVGNFVGPRTVKCNIG